MGTTMGLESVTMWQSGKRAACSTLAARNSLSDSSVATTSATLAAHRFRACWPQVYVAMRDNKVEQGKQLQAQREKDLAAYREKYPQEADEMELIEKGGLPTGWQDALKDIKFEPGKGDATRKHSHQARLWLLVANAGYRHVGATSVQALPSCAIENGPVPCLCTARGFP